MQSLQHVGKLSGTYASQEVWTGISRRRTARHEINIRRH